MIENKVVKLNMLEVYLILVIAFIGVGIMYIPFYYISIGCIISTFSLISVVFFVGFGLRRLAECNAQNKIGYPGMGEMAFGKSLEIIIYLLLFLGQLMYGIAHLAYISDNLLLILKKSTDCDEDILNYIIKGVLALLIPLLLCIKKWKDYSIAFVVSSVIMITTLLLFSVYILIEMKFSRDSDGNIGAKNIAQLIGVCFFSFQGYGAIIPTHRIATSQKSYKTYLYLALFSACALHIIFPFLLYIRADSNQNPASMEFFVVDFNFFVEKIKLREEVVYVLLSLYLGCLIPVYYLVMYPSLRTAEKILKKAFNENAEKPIFRYLIRILLAEFTVIIATIIGEDAVVLIIITGFLICLPLTTIIPSLIHLKLTANSGLDKSLNIVGLVIGHGVMIAGVIMAFNDYWI